MKIERYSRKAQEKFADSLLAMSNVLFSGVLVTLLVAPMAAVAKAMLATDPEQTTSLLRSVLNLRPLEALVFVVLYMVVIFLGFEARREAMKIYSRLHPDAD